MEDTLEPRWLQYVEHLSSTATVDFTKCGAEILCDTKLFCNQCIYPYAICRFPASTLYYYELDSRAASSGVRYSLVLWAAFSIAPVVAFPRCTPLAHWSIRVA